MLSENSFQLMQKLNLYNIKYDFEQTLTQITTQHLLHNITEEKEMYSL